MATGVLASINSSVRSSPHGGLSVTAKPFEFRRPPQQDIAFATFRLLVRSRTLLRDGEPVPLGSRAFDLLHSLTRSAGTIIGKEELVREVWPTTIVEESNLRFQMASLRKALGPYRDLIKTIPGRGYLFTGDCADSAAVRLVPDLDRGIGAVPAPDTRPTVSAIQLRALIDLLEEQVLTLEANPSSS